MKIIEIGEKVNTLIIKLISRLYLNNKSDINNQKIKKGLVFCQMGIGNSILFLPVIKNLIKEKPELELTIIINNRAVYDIFSDQQMPVKLIYSNFHKDPIFKRLRFYRSLKKEKFSFSIMNFLSQKVQNVYLNIFCRIPHRIGHITKSAGGIGKFDFFFNYKVPIKGKHELDFNIDLLQFLIQNDKLSLETPLNINQSAIKKASEYLSQIPGKTKIVLQVYSSFGTHKNWLGKNYIELCKLIQKHNDVAFLLVGSKNEREEIDTIFNGLKVNFFNIAGQFSILETAAIIQQVDLYIGNDGGLGHISAALGQKTYSIIGMTDPNRIKPRGKNVTVFYKHQHCSPCDAIGKVKLYKNCPYNFECMSSITPHMIYKEIIKDNILA